MYKNEIKEFSKFFNEELIDKLIDAIREKGGFEDSTPATKTPAKEEKMTYEEFLKKRPKSVTGQVYSTDWGGGNGKNVKRTYYYGYSKWVDQIGWFNRNKGKSVTDEVAYQLYLEQPSLANGGEIESTDITADLEKFNVDNLDYYEYEQYNHFLPRLGKVESLQLLINTVEGDVSQLSPELAELAEKQGSSYANGGGVSDYKNSPEYKELREKFDRLHFAVKSKVVIAVGLDSAIEFYDADLTIAPYRFIERAVTSNLISLNEINQRLIDSAMEEAEEISNDEDLEEIGSSDFTYYLKSVLDGAGFKVGFVGSTLKRLNEDGSVKEIENIYADGGFMNDVYALGGKVAKTYIFTDDSYVNILLSRGFDEKRSSYGLRFFEHKPTSVFVTYDPKGYQTPIIISKDKSGEESIYEGNSMREVKEALDKLGIVTIKEGIEPNYADGGFMNNVYADGGEIKDIQKMKKTLIAKAKSRGLYENFGQKEVRVLEDKYGYTNNVRDFDNWAMNFDLSQMADGGFMNDVYAKGGELQGKFLAEIKVPYNFEYVVEDEYEFSRFLSKALTNKFNFGNGAWGIKIVKPLFEKDYSKKIVVEIDIPLGVTQGGGLDKFDVLEFMSKTLTKKWFGNGVWGIEVVNSYADGGGVGDELYIYLTSAEDDEEHLVYALYDNNDKIIKSNFEDTTSAKKWAKENGYIAVQYADGGFMNDVYADGGELTNLKKGDRVLLKDGGSSREATVVQDGIDSKRRVRLRPDGFPMDMSVTIDQSPNERIYVIKKLMMGGSYADGGMFDDNDGFMKADNNNNYRYPEMEVYVETIDEPIDLTSNVSSKTNNVVIRTLDENIDLNEDNRIRAKMTYNPINRTPEKMMAVNQRMVVTDLPKPTSNTHKND